MTLRFDVSDTGIGIHPDHQAIVFNSFEQGDSSTTRRFGGTGLGLAITRELVEHMNGEISVESELGRGTTFTFTAVFGQANGDFEVSIPELDEGLEGAPVIALGENPHRLRLLTEMLRDGELIPPPIEGGGRALDLVDRAHVERAGWRAVVLDVDSNPLQIIEALRARRALSALPLVVVAASGSRGDGALYSELGVAAYLTHPLDPSDLIEAVKVAIAAAEEGDRLPLITRHWLREHRRRLKVLVADDSPTNRLLATRLLEKRGHLPTAVENGREALAALEAGTYDVVLMDGQMPEMDGLEATRVLREREAATGGHIPVVALTAHAREEDRQSCLQSGMDAYVAKPFNPHDVYSVIEQLARHEHARDAAEPSSSPPPAVAAPEDEPEDDGLRALLVGAFLGTYPELMSGLTAAVAAGDLDVVAATSHRLKGEFGALGSDVAHAAAADLEAAARNEDEAGVERAWAHFQVVEREVVADLRAAGTELDRTAAG